MSKRVSINPFKTRTEYCRAHETKRPLKEQLRASSMHAQSLTCAHNVQCRDARRPYNGVHWRNTCKGMPSSLLLCACPFRIAAHAYSSTSTPAFSSEEQALLSMQTLVLLCPHKTNMRRCVRHKQNILYCHYSLVSLYNNT